MIPLHQNQRQPNCNHVLKLLITGANLIHPETRSSFVVLTAQAQSPQDQLIQFQFCSHLGSGNCVSSIWKYHLGNIKQKAGNHIAAGEENQIVPQVCIKVTPNLVNKLGPQERVLMTFKLILEALQASKGTQFPAHDGDCNDSTLHKLITEL